MHARAMFYFINGLQGKDYKRFDCPWSASLLRRLPGPGVEDLQPSCRFRALEKGATEAFSMTAADACLPPEQIVDGDRGHAGALEERPRYPIPEYGIHRMWAPRAGVSYPKR